MATEPIAEPAGFAPPPQTTGARRTGRLYCVPTPIADGRPLEADLPAPVIATVAALQHVVAENARTARAFLARLPLARPIQQIRIVELDEHTRDDAIEPMLAPLRAGHDVALVSEAGCPGVADPGARLVLAAHRAGIPVEPVVGPSALLLALMGSGLNGQCFGFAGYLPTDPDGRRRRLQELEARSRRARETVMFIETPYRNQVLFEALTATLQPATWLCVAADLTGARQRLATDRIEGWRRRRPTLDKVPTVFLLLAD
jgi:16S rRNA (cytidine1402-2'-O)-methyltransferase